MKEFSMKKNDDGYSSLTHQALAFFAWMHEKTH